MTLACAFCGLPLTGRVTPEEPVYCCFGCRFAADVAGGGGEAGLNRWALARLGAAIFLAMNVMVFTMALWARDLHPGSDAPLDATITAVFRYLALLFTIPVVWLLGGPLASGAWQSLRAGRPSTDLLLLSGVLAALALSVEAVVRDDGPVYFEVACGVLVFVTLGRWMEAIGKQKAGEALSRMDRLLPDVVRRYRGGTEEQVPAGQAKPGDILRVLQGERVACDGVLLRHPAAFDEQMLTGESQPSVKDVGDSVRAGCLVLEGDAWIRVTAPATQSTAARFLALVRQSMDSRGGYERLAERVARWFLPAVIIVAIAAASGHMMATDLTSGLFAGLAVLLIACPCALGVATPLAVWAALGKAARLGILFRTPDALERTAAARAIRFDKTGTLTTGRAVVVGVRLEPGASAQDVWADAAALAAASHHPFSMAIVEAAEDGAMRPAATTGPVRSQIGGGVAGFTSAPIALGSPGFLAALGYEMSAELQAMLQRELDAGHAVCLFGRDGSVRAVIVMNEELRPEASAALAAVRDLGIDVGILTGDHAVRAAAIAAQLGVPAVGGLGPAEKVAAIQQARRAHGPVAAVGDGLNDTGALAAADAGMAMGCGADLTREVADVCLLGNDLSRAADAIAIARQARRIIRQNLFWALVYNTAGIALACTGRLNPIWAALAMAVSSFSVLGNSLRLAAGFPDMGASKPESAPAPAGVES